MGAGDKKLKNLLPAGVRLNIFVPVCMLAHVG
jgi:hypothetical protein